MMLRMNRETAEAIIAANSPMTPLGNYLSIWVTPVMPEFSRRSEFVAMVSDAELVEEVIPVYLANAISEEMIGEFADCPICEDPIPKTGLMIRRDATRYVEGLGDR